MILCVYAYMLICVCVHLCGMRACVRVCACMYVCVLCVLCVGVCVCVLLCFYVCGGGRVCVGSLPAPLRRSTLAAAGGRAPLFVCCVAPCVTLCYSVYACM